MILLHLSEPGAPVLKLRFFGLGRHERKEVPPQLRNWVDYGFGQYPYSPEPRKEPPMVIMPDALPGLKRFLKLVGLNERILGLDPV